ncbi:MAG: DUF2062 domain-containing protein [Opitutus sp.]
MSSEHRHRRIRRVKQWLRFMPRRAVFHRYPLVGRFAAFARREAYLWSFRRTEVRRAAYVGSILSMMPMMGVQLPLALVLAILLRCNFMVMGILQVITNPFTAIPIYGATFVLGRRLLRIFDFPMHGAQLPDGWTDMGLGEIFGHMDMSTAIGQGVICLLVGGVAAGLCLGALLDGVHYLGIRGAAMPPPAADKPEDPTPIP